MTPGKVYEFVFKGFLFLQNFENARKNIMKSENFFVFVLYCTKRRCSEIKPQLKVELENGCEAKTFLLKNLKIESTLLQG